MEGDNLTPGPVFDPDGNGPDLRCESEVLIALCFLPEGGGGGPLHVLPEGGGPAEAWRQGHVLHAEEGPQPALGRWEQWGGTGY